MSAVTHPRARARRGRVRPGSWWAKAWLRAVEEAAYASEDLRAARKLARSGAVGQVTVDAGSFVAAVLEGGEAVTVTGSCERLDQWDLFVELVAAASGRVGSLLTGDLPIDLVEQSEEGGIELLPYAGDLAWSCTCEPWVPPCRHALAVAHQLAWLLDDDPFVLLHLRGLARDELLARLHERSEDAAEEGSDPDLDVAADAVDRARRALGLLEEGRSADHLF